MASRPGPQLRRCTKPIDTALTAAVPINVSTTRRERFMLRPLLFEIVAEWSIFADDGPMGQAKRGDFTPSCGLRGSAAQLSSAAAGKAERARKGAEAASRHAARAGIGGRRR